MIWRLLLAVVLVTGPGWGEEAPRNPAVPGAVVDWIQNAIPGVDGSDLLGRALSILRPDQVERLKELRLQPDQAMRLLGLAMDLAPEFAEGRIGPDVRPRLSGILDPRQVDLLESLQPSAHQLSEMTQLLQELQGRMRGADLDGSGMTSRLFLDLERLVGPEQRKMIEAMAEFMERARARR
ncbi:MAG: hypothetical protein HY319_13635 [Armatimonadetes bacterium]|nr:hypothetical protein [Armatimonadota bacterium]